MAKFNICHGLNLALSIDSCTVFGTSCTTATTCCGWGIWPGQCELYFGSWNCRCFMPGISCSQNIDCCSNVCTLGLCGPSPNGSLCRTNVLSNPCLTGLECVADSGDPNVQNYFTSIGFGSSVGVCKRWLFFYHLQYSVDLKSSF